MSEQAWSGRWACDRLGLALHTERGVGGLTLPDLVGLAVRRNPRRAHLLVSTVLGKHVPTDPRIVYGAGRLLGELVADALTDSDSGFADIGGKLVADALAGDSDAADELLARCETRPVAAV